MAITYVCSFDHYGPASGTLTGVSEWHIGGDNFIGDGWIDFPRRLAVPGNSTISGSYNFAAPSWGARAGDYSLLADTVMVQGPTFGSDIIKESNWSMRLGIPGASSARRLIHFAFSISELPSVALQTGYICDFIDGSNNIRGSLVVSPTGRLQVIDFTGMTLDVSTQNLLNPPNVLASSSAPVIQPQTWYFLSIDLDINVDGTADIDIYVGDIVPANKVIGATNLVFKATASNNIDIVGFLPASLLPSGVSDGTQRAIRDIVLADTTGVRNNSLLGQCFVSAQEMREEDLGGGWVANPRQNIGDGILNSETNNTGLRYGDAASLEIGAADFTFETWLRFHTLPNSVSEANVLAKWRTNDSNRSYRLVYYGSDNTIRWEVSTDGISTVTVKRIPWTPILDQWYHVAVVRSTSQTLLFIDGRQFGVPVADANTYFNGVASLGVAARFDGTSTLITGSSFDGWMDETRFTVGIARYTSNFTPSTGRFGRNVTDDPSFASVVLLLGYDGLSLADESSFARATNTTAPALTAIQPDDAARKYNVLNNRPYIDDTYIEAAQTYAEGTFTFDAVPTNTETMTVGAKVYTWKTVLAAANDILIGATVADCINNAIAAINDSGGEGTIYGVGTTANADALAIPFESPQFTLRAVAIGTAGNAVVTTETMTNGFFDDATLTGGQNIPADSDFAIERLPADVTGVLGVQMTMRHYKTDAGAAQVRIDLKGPAGAIAAGTAQSPDLNPAWARQIFESDPDTAANLTPSTMIGGRIRFKRTV